MAYVSEHSSRQRAQTLVAVGLLHGVAVWAIVSGFAGGMVDIVRNTLVAHQYPDEVMITPIAPPDVKPSQPAVETKREVPKSEITLAPLDPGVTIRDIEKPVITPVEGGGLIDPKATPSPTPSDTFAVRQPSPKSAPGSWVSDRDYPSAAIREEREGVTRFQLGIGPDGRVTGCEVTGSSGSTDLDAATCAKVSARARFTPALGSDGMPMAGRYSGAVRWVLP
jgi:protein TonB